jgi:hypothetical protein
MSDQPIQKGTSEVSFGPGESRRRWDKFVRWQGVAINQLGYASNLVLGLSTGSLGFAFAQVRGRDFDLGRCGKVAFVILLVLLLLSVVSGLACSINRLCDFRKTEGIARDKAKWYDEGKPEDEIDRGLRKRRCETEMLGRRTWKLFSCQIYTFAAGAVLLVIMLAVANRAKLF